MRYISRTVNAIENLIWYSESTISSLSSTSHQIFAYLSSSRWKIGTKMANFHALFIQWTPRGSTEVLACCYSYCVDIQTDTWLHDHVLDIFLCLDGRDIIWHEKDSQNVFFLNSVHAISRNIYSCRISFLKPNVRPLVCCAPRLRRFQDFWTRPADRRVLWNQLRPSVCDAKFKIIILPTIGFS